MGDSGQYGRFWPIRCRIEGNLYYNNTRSNQTEWSRCAPEVLAKNIIKNDSMVGPEDFVDYDQLDLRFKKNDSKFPEIPFAKIGLYLDQYRSSRPEKSHYRRTINRFFEGIGSMPGTTKQIDTALVVESGPMVTK